MSQLGHSRRFKREVAREQPMKFLLWQVIDRHCLLKRVASAGILT
jgi:hypothetical protein